jgi:undecaprenyl-diphosphatase
MAMNLIEALPLGILEGVTEFLPVSSTGHLTIAEGLLGLKVDDPGVTAFTAIIQVGAILAVIIYFRSDIGRLASAWLRGLVNGQAREAPDYRFAWYVILGSIPIGIVGFLAQGPISVPLRNLWVVVVVALVGWSAVMWIAERVGKRDRPESSLNLKDAVIIGLVQCVALIPGVSRSGATISAGLLRDLDRVAATRLAFFLAIPALVAAGAYQAIREASVISTGVGWLPTVLATGVSFVVGYASIAWLLRFVAKHRITVFIWYRVALAAVIAVLLGTGMLMRFSTLRRISSLIGRTASTPLPAGSSSTQSS